MSCRVSIDGRLPPHVRLAARELRRAAAFFAEKSSARVGVPFREVSIILHDDAGSAAAHRAVMDVEGPTDVITQGFDAMPGEEPGVYGELYVNWERAVAAAPARKGWSSAKELLLYVAHGMDHLSGADDHSPRDCAAMRRRELRWLAAFDSDGASGSGA